VLNSVLESSAAVNRDNFLKKVFDFKKKNRLLSRPDFQAVFKHHSHKVTTQQFTVLLQSQQASHNTDAKLGIIVPKQKTKHAVVRNRIRRVIRESFRHQKYLLKGWNIIVLLRSQCSTVDKKLLREKVDQLWRQVNHY